MYRWPSTFRIACPLPRHLMRPSITEPSHQSSSNTIEIVAAEISFACCTLLCSPLAQPLPFGRAHHNILGESKMESYYQVWTHICTDASLNLTKEDRISLDNRSYRTFSSLRIGVLFVFTSTMSNDSSQKVCGMTTAIRAKKRRTTTSGSLTVQRLACDSDVTDGRRPSYPSVKLFEVRLHFYAQHPIEPILARMQKRPCPFFERTERKLPRATCQGWRALVSRFYRVTRFGRRPLCPCALTGFFVALLTSHAGCPYS